MTALKKFVIWFSQFLCFIDKGKLLQLGITENSFFSSTTLISSTRVVLVVIVLEEAVIALPK